MKTIEVMDTTLRDGEQTPGVNYTPEEKLVIAEALLRAGVDAIEVASVGISKGEAEAVRRIMDWAHSHGAERRIEILGFVDHTRSVDWIVDNGGHVLNLLTKGSEHHCRVQLKKSVEEHLQDIAKTVEYALSKGLTVNVYLEDWSQGMQNSESYVMALTEGLTRLPIKRAMLCDTLGVLAPEQSERFVRCMTQRFDIPFDFHGHNDYGLAVSNSIVAIRSGAGRVHVTTNGLGERAGNTTLATFVVTARDLYGFQSNVKEESLAMLSDLVAGISGVDYAANSPVIGYMSSIQGCGVHADGDNKGGLYQNRLDPARFGLKRTYDLGKTAGMASIEQNCKQLGIEITPEQQRALLAKVKELGDQKVTVTQADIILLLQEILNTKENGESGIRLTDYQFTLKKGTQPQATIHLCVHSQPLTASGVGDGQFDAFMNALRTICPEMPELVNYHIGISRKGTSGALTEVTITWSKDDNLFTTRAVNPDQLVAAMNATIRMLNYVDLRQQLSKN